MKKHSRYLMAITIFAIIAVVAVFWWRSSNKPPTVSGSKNEAVPSVITHNAPVSVVVTDHKVNLLFGGDVMFGRTVDERISQYGGSWPLKNLGPTMSQSDITVVNLESPFRQDAPRTLADSLILRGNPAGLDSLKEAGVDLVSLANNHITDMGLSGLQQTKKLLSDSSINYVGAGESANQASQSTIIVRNGTKFGFLSYTYGVNFNSSGVYYNVADPAQASKDVAALKEQVDMVIVLAHFGTEYKTKENQAQTTFAHSVIDAGASLVVGAHPHVPEPLEQYNGGIIFYSLGNLVFDQAPGEGRDYSALASISTNNGKLLGVDLLPYRIFNYGQPAFITSKADQEKVWDMFSLPSGKLSLTSP